MRRPRATACCATTERVFKLVKHVQPDFLAKMRWRRPWFRQHEGPRGLVVRGSKVEVLQSHTPFRSRFGGTIGRPRQDTVLRVVIWNSGCADVRSRVSGHNGSGSTDKLVTDACSSVGLTRRRRREQRTVVARPLHPSFQFDAALRDLGALRFQASPGQCTHVHAPISRRRITASISPSAGIFLNPTPRKPPVPWGVPVARECGANRAGGHLRAP